MMPGISIIGELINHSFARAQRAWAARSLEAYQELAVLQRERGARFLTVNIQGTSRLAIGWNEVAAFLPRLVAALQEAVDLPLAFDSPDIEYHRIALAAYDRRRAGGEAPIVNSLSASRQQLEEWFALVREADARALVMASEGFGPGGESRANRTAEEVHETARWFVAKLRSPGARRAEQIIVDPGLVPIAADTSGLVNRTLDSLELMSSDPELRGVHFSVGLTNFSFGLPRTLRVPVENAFLTIAARAGLDTVLGNPEKDYRLLPADDTVLTGLAAALAAGRPAPGQSAEDAGFAMIERLTELYREGPGSSS